MTQVNSSEDLSYFYYFKNKTYGDIHTYRYIARKKWDNLTAITFNYVSRKDGGALPLTLVNLMSSIFFFVVRTGLSD